MTTSYDQETGILSGGNYSLDGDLAKAICEACSPVRIADLGCGRGDYCKFWSERGYEIDGYEGSGTACQESVYANIECVDLSKPAIPKADYDLVICLEVGEHIPKKCQDVFLDNLDRFSKNVLILSWALPGQRGTGHVNCLSNEGVVELMSMRGLGFDKNLSDHFRQKARLGWFKKTLMVFRRTWYGESHFAIKE